MAAAFSFFYVILIYFGTLSGAVKVATDNNLVNKDVQRKVDLSTSLAKVTSDITLENGGSKNVAVFLLSIEPSMASSLSSVAAFIKAGEDDSELVVEPATTENNPAGALLFQVVLAKPLMPGKTVTVSVTTTYSHVLKPFPAEIKQAEKQMVKFSGNLVFYSPYKTTSQKTVVNLASSSVESYTKTKPNTKSESTITYGPFGPKEEYASEELYVHAENNSPFLAVTSMERVIEVSHWGNIAIEETYDLRHTGAKLKGPFSRYDYQRQMSQLSSIKSFKTVLPASARDVYYRDEIGNISTSNMKELDEAVELELRPRFPLFGGWKTHYMIGYNVPSYQYLWTDGGNGYALRMPFVDHVFDNQVIDDITVKIILPEGAKVGDISLPYEVSRGNDELLATYLDTIGRPVIVLHKTNLVQDHIKDFKLSYSFSKMMLLREPFLVVGFFYAIFLVVIVYVRLDFSISRDIAAEAKMKAAGQLENAQTVLDRRSALYQSYEDATNKYKASKDLSAFQAQRKKIEADHKKLNDELTSLHVELKSSGADAASEKLGEIQKLDSAYKESVGVSAQLAEKLVAAKISKDAYLHQEEEASNKRSDIASKLEALSNQLL